MVTYTKVRSAVEPKSIEFDEVHVSINKNIRVIPNEERTDIVEGQEVTPMYEYDTDMYNKDEFLEALQSGQVTLDNRASFLETTILEISEAVYA